ncbi:polyprenyl synthetase [Streptomyces viridosporus ATCC 14672]|uniref:Polyprenyl synthetase n=1 Tax=Streptomyces viridosporus (strain ATCC 14672 / DSM 40746 / JCM 4963 / KCTC 9882 / NRRL B-12104 / FH 1290) TaxID=566461 RepID=D6A8Y5_STRV1|nr:polyprenyl synthetase family protein [Streptomyces viridosporus]EFE66203.1 polyprenyl synthetase [Streptomyces viridosporus ATCC 14672]
MSIAVTPVGSTHIPLLEAELLRWVGSGDSLLEVACLDALFPPGKLLRPILCMESAKAVGGTAEQVLAFAAGIECLHVASLIHDDIVDQDPVRRGRASTAEQYGLAEALVAGDGLSMAGIAAMLSGGPAERVLHAARVTVEALRHMCQGIMRETEIRGDLTCAVPTVLNVIHDKTAALTGAACQAGAILAGATPGQTQALHQYGEQLGMAFQIRDDLLPYTAEDQITGKSAISDVANLQPTLPVLLAYEVADTADRDRLTTAFRSETDPVTAHRDILAVLTRTGALTKAAQMASSCAEQARAALTGLPDSTRLAELATSAADRRR